MAVGRLHRPRRVQRQRRNDVGTCAGRASSKSERAPTSTIVTNGSQPLAVTFWSAVPRGRGAGTGFVFARLDARATGTFNLAYKIHALGRATIPWQVSSVATWAKPRLPGGIRIDRAVASRGHALRTPDRIPLPQPRQENKARTIRWRIRGHCTIQQGAQQCGGVKALEAKLEQREPFIVRTERIPKDGVAHEHFLAGLKVFPRMRAPSGAAQACGTYPKNQRRMTPAHKRPPHKRFISGVSKTVPRLRKNKGLVPHTKFAIDIRISPFPDAGVVHSPETQHPRRVGSMFSGLRGSELCSSA